MFATQMFTFLLSLVLASHPPHRHQNNNRHKPVESSSSSSLAQQGVALTFDSGLYPFTFGKGNQGDYADQYFYFWVPENPDSDISYQLLVTDCYCGGDRFMVFDDFWYGNGQTEALNNCANATPLCNVYYGEPKECVIKMAEMGFGQQDLCFARLNLQKGSFHNITIQVATSPFGSGTGFIWPVTYNPSNDRPACYNQIPGGWNQCLWTVHDY